MRAGRALALAVLFAAGCTSRTIPEPAPIPIPVGLEAAEVDEAIRIALKTTRDGRGWKQGHWQIEQAAPGHIVARLLIDGRALRLAVEYTDAEVTTRIVDSHALRQQGDEIHWRALSWQTHVESSIRKELEWSARRQGLF